MSRLLLTLDDIKTIKNLKTTCWQIRVLSVLSNIHKLEIGKQDDVEEQVWLLTLKACFETYLVLL